MSKSVCDQCERVRSDVAYWDCWVMALCNECLTAFTHAYNQGYRDGERGLKR